MLRPESGVDHSAVILNLDLKNCDSVSISVYIKKGYKGQPVRSSYQRPHSQPSDLSHALFKTNLIRLFPYILRSNLHRAIPPLINGHQSDFHFSYGS